MNEKLILEKLEKLSNDIQDIKTDIILLKSAHSIPTVSEESQRDTGLSTFVEVTHYLREIDAQINTDEIKQFIDKTLTSLSALTEAMDVLRSGIELRDELVPIAELSYPRMVKFLNNLHEGEFQAEDLGRLMHTFLLNVHTFSDLMNMISPMTEFVKDFEVVMRQTDVLSTINKWLDSLQQGNGVMKLLAVTVTAFKNIELTDEQFDQMCASISTINFSKVEPVGPLSMLKQFRDPQFQEAMGAIFMLIRAIGGCINACQDKSSHQGK